MLKDFYFADEPFYQTFNLARPHEAVHQLYTKGSVASRSWYFHSYISPIPSQFSRGAINAKFGLNVRPQSTFVAF